MQLPKGFVYLADVAPAIVQDIRYAGYHNFVGRPIAGYNAAECILTERAANALAGVQAELERSDLTLRVYDGYRPQRAVGDFLAWSGNAADQKMKAEFYPRVDKARLFELGYVAAKSSHSRGSTVDLTIEPRSLEGAQTYRPGDPLRPGIGTFEERCHDGSIDMGSCYDCMDMFSHLCARVDADVAIHRRLLRALMESYGFTPYHQEWWHFTLRDEPFPDTYFDFPIEDAASDRCRPAHRRGAD